MEKAIIESKGMELEKGTNAVSIRNDLAEMEVTDKESFQFASEEILKIDAMIKERRDFVREPKREADKLKKFLLDLEKRLVNPLQGVRDLLNGRVSAYLTKQERIRREEQDRLNREREEKERKEKEILEAAAQSADEQGETELACELLDRSESTIVPQEIIEPVIQKTTRMEVGTVSQRKNTQVIITDPVALLRAIADGRAPITLMEFKIGNIKRWVKLNQIKNFPGLNIKEIVAGTFRGKGIDWGD